MSIFEYIAYTQPYVLLALEALGLLVIDDYIPLSAARLMRARAYRRVGRRLKQVRSA